MVGTLNKTSTKTKFYFEVTSSELIDVQVEQMGENSK